MKGYIRIIFIVNLIFFLAVFNWKIVEKEWTLQTGGLVLLEIYPLDPRSLMQGDYMRLRYEMTRQWEPTSLKKGYCILKMGEKNIGTYDRMQKGLTPLAKDEVAIRFNRSGNLVNIGAESFLFEEGQERTYQRAKYSGLQVDENGSIVLVGLYDKDAKQIINTYRQEN